jgi:predicted nucleic acid-binding protein
MKTVYIETSVISYLTSRPSRNLIAAAHQQITQQWWDTQRARFKVYISPVVEEEAAEGNRDAAARRLAAMKDIEILEATDSAALLTRKLIEEGALPKTAEDDAAHIAIAAVHNIDYLVTWNCRHIDNAETKPVIRAICAVNGFVCPEICTPGELMGDWHDER